MSDIDYIRRPEPIVAPQVVAPVVAPVPMVAPAENLYGYDGSFGRRLLGKFGTDVLTFNQLDDYANAIPLALSVMLLPLLFMDFTDAKFIKSTILSCGLLFYYSEVLVNALLDS
jgi:hypothetical protein